MAGRRLDLEIRGYVADYVAGLSTFEDFEDLLLGASWGLKVPVIEELVADIELPVAEFTGGHMNEDRLRENLRALVTTYSVRALRICGTALPASDAVTQASARQITAVVR